MPSRQTITQLQRDQLITLFESGVGFRAASRIVGVSVYSARMMERRWRLHGTKAATQKREKTSYSYETKREVVEKFLAGATRMELAKEYELSSDDLVKGWVRTYRREGWEGLRPKPRGRRPKNYDRLLAELNIQPATQPKDNTDAE